MNVKHKQCTGYCGESLPANREHFHSHASKTDGLTSECKVCYNARLRKYGKENRERRTEIERNHRLTHQKEHQCRLDTQKAYAENRLQRGPCVICGSLENIEAHHNNYDNHLDVIELCKTHHSEVDVVRRQAIKRGVNIEEAVWEYINTHPEKVDSLVFA